MTETFASTIRTATRPYVAAIVIVRPAGGGEFEP